MPPGPVIGGMSEEAPNGRWFTPNPPWTVFHPMQASVMESLFVHHVCPSSNFPLHEHVLSFPKVRWLLFHWLVILYPSGWPPSDLSERIVHIAKEVWYLGAFQWYVACWCIICSQAQTATSTRKSIHHMEPGWCPHDGIIGEGSRYPPL